MHGRCVRKVPGGKLLKVDVTVSDDTLKGVRITGDFFAHPEYIIEMLEKRLAGNRRSEVGDSVEKFFRENDAELYGVDRESIAKAVLEAWDGVQAA